MNKALIVVDMQNDFITGSLKNENADWPAVIDFINEKIDEFHKDENGAVIFTRDTHFKCNRSEDYVGYSTKYGDSCGDFSLLNNLTVTQVVKLADYLNIPIELGHKTPDDGMSGVSDETKLGFTYAELDKFLTEGVKGSNYERIKALHENPNTKLKLLPMYNPFGAVLSETTIEEEKF